MKFLKEDEILECIMDTSKILKTITQCPLGSKLQCIIKLKPINNIDYRITGCSYGYQIEVKKTEDSITKSEVLYHKNFAPKMYLKIRNIAKALEKIREDSEKCENLKRMTE